MRSGGPQLVDFVLFELVGVEAGEEPRHAYTDGVLGLVDQIASILAPGDPQSARGQTLSLFALLIGTLQLSRSLADRRLADEVLERGIENALALLPGD